MHAYNFFVSGPNFTNFSQGMKYGWSTTFSMFDTLNLSGDIRDQSRKLSKKITLNFGLFLPSQIL